VSALLMGIMMRTVNSDGAFLRTNLENLDMVYLKKDVLVPRYTLITFPITVHSYTSMMHFLKIYK